MTSSPHNPDGRDLLEFADAVAAGTNPQPLNDLERTYLHVHTAMRGESAAIPASQKQSTWEDVMSTLTLAPEQPISNRTKRQRGLAKPAFTPKRLRWTPLASIAAVALIVLASMGIWRMNTMPDESMPPLAPQVAGIVSGDDIAMQVATPGATAVEASDGSRSIPIVQHVDEQPMDGPVIWLTTSGDVMYDDGAEVTRIASNATQVTPHTTNVIRVTTNAPEKDGTDRDGSSYEGTRSTYHHLITRKTLVDDGTFSSYLSDQNMHLGSLTVLTITDAPREWSIVNFDTMESKSISELTGGFYPSSESISVTVSDDFSTIAIATSQYQSEGSSILMRQSSMPGEVAVITSDLTEAFWVSVPEDMPAVGNISLSPDGSKIAFISADNFRGGSNMTIAVVDVATGEQVVRTQQVESSTFSHFQWVDDGSAFVIIAAKTVQKYALDAAEPTVIFETDGTINQMPQFGVSNLLHLQVSSADLSMTTPTPETSQFVILNTATGETMTVDGKPWYMGASYPVQMTQTLAPIPVSQDGKTAVLVHPITGEVLPDLVANVDDPTMRPDFEPKEGSVQYPLQTVTTALRAPVSVVNLADGNLAIVTTTTDSFDVRTVEGPVGAENLQLGLSPYGNYLFAGPNWGTENETQFVLSLDDVNADWVQSSPGSTAQFVEIRDEQP